jgi:hypothetical protein
MYSTENNSYFASVEPVGVKLSSLSKNQKNVALEFEREKNGKTRRC